MQWGDVLRVLNPLSHPRGRKAVADVGEIGAALKEFGHGAAQIERKVTGHVAFYALVLGR